MSYMTLMTSYFPYITLNYTFDLHLTHRTIALTGYTGPLTLTQVHTSVSTIVR